MSDSIWQEARRLTQLGWAVHPLSSPKDPQPSAGKRPLEPGWQKRGKATEAELKAWFKDTNNNMGLVCGKASGITVIDLDKMDWLGALFPPEQNLIEDTLMSNRTSGRGHIYFEYSDHLPSKKLHEFGIEVLSDGNNAVLPPSVHAQGQTYHWKDASKTPSPIPKITIKNISLLKSLSQKIKECRPCFRHVILQSNDAMHGMEGRRLMLAVSTELKAQDTSVDELLLYARKVYGDKYDAARTKREYKNCDESKTWRCETIRNEFPLLAKLCPDCPIRQLDKDYIDVQTKEKALEILEHGDPIKFIIDAWNKIHSGDAAFGYVLLCSAVSNAVVSSDGIPINFNGDSGGGKSHACRTMLHLIPQKYWSKKSLSSKALFYSSSIRKGTILFSDDVIMGDDVKTIYKNSVSDFQEEVEHETVDVNRKGVTLKAPPQITWWLTSVTDPGNAEIERRTLKIVIDTNKDRTAIISARLGERKRKAEAKYPEYPDVIICRAIFSIIKATPEKIIIPYKIKFNEDVGIDTQNLVYELIYSTTLLNKYQRKRTENNEIISIPDDFNLVISNFMKISDTQISKYTKSELVVVQHMKALAKVSPYATVTSDELQLKFGKSKGWVSQVFKGKNGNGGLLSKSPNIIEEDISTKDESDTVRKKHYKFVGEWNELSLYDAVAVIVP